MLPTTRHLSQDLPLPSKEEWGEWLDHPVTKALRAILRQRIEITKDEWASGAFTAQDQFGTCIANARAIGVCEAFEDVLDIHLVEFEVRSEEPSNEE